MPLRFLLLAVCVLVGLGLAALFLEKRFTPLDTISTVSATPGSLYATAIQDSNGEHQSLAQWQNKVLVINFWATWCPPCIEEMPELMALQTRYASKNLQIVGIAADNALSAANFGKKTQVNYPLLADEAGALALSKRLGNPNGYLPHTVIILPGGKTAYNKVGRIKLHELTAIIDEYVAKR